MLLLVSHDLGVYVVYNIVLDGTTINTLQPLLAVVLFPKFVVLALERRFVNPIDTVHMAPTPAQNIWMFATALQQVCQCTALGGIQMHHPLQRTPRFSWEQSEDRFLILAASCN